MGALREGARPLSDGGAQRHGRRRIPGGQALQSILPELGADIFTVSRGMVNTRADIKGTDIWVNFTETETGVLCELRSSRYNINPIAVKYGGGGHAKASGATVASKEIAMQMLSDLDALTKE